MPLIQSLSITARSPEFLYLLYYLPKGPYLPVSSAVEECFSEVHYAYSAVLPPSCSQYDEPVIPFTQTFFPSSDFQSLPVLVGLLSKSAVLPTALSTTPNPGQVI